MPAHAARIASLEAQISTLKTTLQTLESELSAAKTAASTTQHGASETPPSKWPLSTAEYKRYGRQLVMPEIGLPGQLRLRGASVLIVGVGGLGCPAAMYLAAAGVGSMALVDGDVVDESNLHRQVLYGVADVGKSKAESAAGALARINPLPQYTPHATPLTPRNALALLAPHDLVLDCTDTPASRYLVSDACVLLGKPLVTAAALRTDGQLMVLNDPPLPAGRAGGPCYRCIFPRAPPAGAAASCEDNGILGPVVGVMGVLQAVEAVRVIVGMGERVAGGAGAAKAPELVLFSAGEKVAFRSVRLRGRKKGCAACSENASVTRESLTGGGVDYVHFCNMLAPEEVLRPEERMSASSYAEMRCGSVDTGGQGRKHVLIDVRDKVQFDLCHLEGSHNMPYPDIALVDRSNGTNGSEGVDTNAMQKKVEEIVGENSDQPVVVVCRLGNDSQLAVQWLKNVGIDRGGKRWVGDIKGGLRSWSKEQDPTFPHY